MPKPEIDYSLYLVTGRHLLPPGTDYFESLEESLKGGVTVVQVREKTEDTHTFLEIAKRTQDICARYKVPVIINDRIDIALAINAVGVHLGQTDMPYEIACQLLPESTIIGLSVSSPEEAKRASKLGVDYVGIGPVWWTTSKTLQKDVIGVRGVGAILSAISPQIKAVGIGGIKQNNLIRTLHGGVAVSGRGLDGIAVISEIVSSPDPFTTAQRLLRTVLSFIERPFPQFIFAPWLLPFSPTDIPSASLTQRVASLIDDTRSLTPLVHQITNAVAMTQSANVTLGLGASPIMATAPAEMEDLSHAINALLVNFGTIGDLQGMLLAGHSANRVGKPVVFDPVAVGATSHRRKTADELLNTWQATVIKGNAAEIGALAGLNEVASRGVDSVGPGFSDPEKVVKDLALRERCVVVLTGADDWISDGQSIIKCSNGNKLLAGITASGCIVGTAIATYCGAVNMLARKHSKVPAVDHGNGRLIHGDMLLGSVAGILAITVAAEMAAERPGVHGTGTFLPALIDELGSLAPKDILARARVTQIA